MNNNKEISGRKCKFQKIITSCLLRFITDENRDGLLPRFQGYFVISFGRTNDSDGRRELNRAASTLPRKGFLFNLQSVLLGAGRVERAIGRSLDQRPWNINFVGSATFSAFERPDLLIPRDIQASFSVSDQIQKFAFSARNTKLSFMRPKRDKGNESKSSQPDQRNQY
ncbi:tRNA (guanine-N(1)-)-methyltransferase [Striga asiatica]|uniref:tRNA (Guanine-N(1)-)-methyltransferase n=1 Tax=Striga asiatica TaxID=4170 RepID=A0A5A7P439_STRAF|nr:tRNA (guanine-N(1)-)-methyltransferase [Striga asiatica]